MTTPVTLVGGGPGAWDLITVRGQRALQDAEVILADHLGPTASLDKLCDISAKEVVDCSKLPYGKQVAQEKINEMMVQYASAGKRVVRLKGGDAFVFGRGFEEVQALAEHGIPATVVPGVTSAISVPELAGIPVTQRGVVHSFTVISGHLAPGNEHSLNDWEALARSGGTLAIIMGVKHSGEIAEALIGYGKPETTPTAVIQEGSTEAQRSYRCTLGDLAATIEREAIKPPAVIVIGEVAGL